MNAKLKIKLKMECRCPYCNSKIDLFKNDFYVDGHNLILEDPNYLKEINEKKIEHQVLCPNCEQIFVVDTVNKNF